MRKVRVWVTFHEDESKDPRAYVAAWGSDSERLAVLEAQGYREVETEIELPTEDFVPLPHRSVRPNEVWTRIGSLEGALAEAWNLLGERGDRPLSALPDRVRGVKVLWDKCRADRDAYRKTLEEISQMLRMPGSPHLVHDVTRRVEGIVRAIDNLLSVMRG